MSARRSPSVGRYKTPVDDPPSFVPLKKMEDDKDKVESKPKNDDFYQAWDSFLAKASRRSTSASSLARRIKRTQKSVGHQQEGLHIQEKAFTSYEQARAKCVAKVVSQ